ncbi:GNAT family N-acetyltransferase [Zobellia roscoffensis]|uniref:GNAT family N-acetyltransferase n=1 Tax=Zobellia roscoffensis TaxID=2779508 RepID=UPI00188B34C8|nr:GNAT family N-acetyltransferase [Zobellia roscoffensis]
MDLLLEGEKTERLLFRKVLPSDFDTWLPFHKDKRSSEFWKGLPSDPKIACQQQFDRIFERYENGLGGMNALILKSTGDLIGLCGLLKQNVDNIEELEIGYSILPKYWKQGYASEAAKKCKMHARNNRLAPSLISIIHIDNIPSQRVAMNNGMHLEKTTTYHNNPVYIFRVLL